MFWEDNNNNNNQKFIDLHAKIEKKSKEEEVSNIT